MNCHIVDAVLNVRNRYFVSFSYHVILPWRLFCSCWQKTRSQLGRPKRCTDQWMHVPFIYSKYRLRLRTELMNQGSWLDRSHRVLCCSSSLYERVTRHCLLMTDYMYWKSTCIMYRTTAYWTFCSPLLSIVTRYIGFSMPVIETVNGLLWEACHHDWWHNYDLGNRLQTISRIRIRYVWFLLFGQLGIRSLEFTMSKSFADFVGKHGKSLL